ncbi:MAG: hypothetical protein E7374_01580 [Clostridiales bacterium]|nr:hypothetical protein [Clostridiales bacterium]
MRKNVKKINILKYFYIFFIFLILGNSNLGGLNPFVYAFLFACLFVGFDEKLVGVFALVGAMVSNLTMQNLFIALTFVAVALINFYIHKLIKQRIRLITNFLVFLLSNVTYAVYNYSEILNLIYFILLGVISLYVFTVVLQVVELRKNCIKLTLDEGICFLFLIGVLGSGIADVNILNFSVTKLALVLILFLTMATNYSALTYSVSLSLASGVALSTGSIEIIAEIAFLMLVSGIFKLPNKNRIVLVSILGEVFIQYFFFMKSFDMFYEVLPVIVAGAIFILIPNKWLNSLSDLVYVKRSEMTSRNLINTTRKNLRKRMAELSNVFLDMKQIHMGMVKKELTSDELKNMFMREIMSCCCKDCLDKNRCTRSLGLDNASNLETLVNIAITKGKVTLLDIPSSLSNRCANVNQLINLINRIIDEYKQYKNMMTDVNNVKILLADQMGAVSRLLLDVGKEIDTNVTFDIARENKIISRLLSLNVECKEVLLYTEKNEDVSAVLIVKKGQEFNPVIEKVLTETLKLPMQIVSALPFEETDYFTVTLRKKTKFDCVFGLASCNKSGNLECGDCHSIIRLGADKFLLALCDGMGNGKSAHKMSALTLGLIENFYKVGFDNDIIIESVNKLLSINNHESYSTLDMCLIDLNKVTADFIKVGAPFGAIKRESSFEIVEGGSLPIGALDTIKPYIYRSTVSTKDIVIMATDGITDAFETSEKFEEFVSSLANNNPQTIAETILNEALSLNEMSAKDDMTVLVARTYLKN